MGGHAPNECARRARRESNHGRSGAASESASAVVAATCKCIYVHEIGMRAGLFKDNFRSEEMKLEVHQSAANACAGIKAQGENLFSFSQLLFSQRTTEGNGEIGKRVRGRLQIFLSLSLFLVLGINGACSIGEICLHGRCWAELGV